VGHFFLREAAYQKTNILASLCTGRVTWHLLLHLGQGKKLRDGLLCCLRIPPTAEAVNVRTLLQAFLNMSMCHA
jgi:hypothetical protein